MLFRRRQMKMVEANRQIPHIQLEVSEGKASLDGKHVPLTPRETEILNLLLTHRGKLVAKADLMQHLYGEMDLPDDKIIDVFICKLRKKLAQAGAENVIDTVWGRGFSAYPNHPSVQADNISAGGAPRSMVSQTKP